MEKSIYINRYLPITFLYFFLNSIFLPLGLLYTTLLTPLFFIWLYVNHSLQVLWVVVLATLLFACIHFIHGVDILSYSTAYLNFIAAIIFGLSLRLFLTKVNNLRLLFKDIIIWNFILTLVAIIFFFIPHYNSIFWYDNVITNGTTSLKRLKMFTYEASYYSTLLAPLALYYYLKIILFKTRSGVLIFLMISIPLILSFSLGVLSGIIISILILFLSDIKLFFFRKKMIKYILLGFLLLILILIILIRVYPDNILFKRITNIFSGVDTSFKGRTTDSFYLAWLIARKKSILFGCGLGQIKLLGPDVLSFFYKSNFTAANTVIPNSMAETLAIYGIVGFVLRLGLEIYLFFKTKVFQNYYRLTLFVFIFIYQFTGSFITNIAEYTIWVLAFSDVFDEFNKNHLFSREINI